MEGSVCFHILYRKKPPASPVSSHSNSPPTNHTDAWPTTSNGDQWPTANHTESWPSLAVQSKSNDVHSQSLEEGLTVTNNHTSDNLTESPPTGINVPTKPVRHPSSEGKHQEAFYFAEFALFHFVTLSLSSTVAI